MDGVTPVRYASPAPNPATNASEESGAPVGASGPPTEPTAPASPAGVGLTPAPIEGATEGPELLGTVPSDVPVITDTPVIDGPDPVIVGEGETPSPVTPPVTPPVVTGPPGTPSGPLAFIWNDQYFQRIAPGDGMDVTNQHLVQDRVVKSVLQYFIEDPDVDDFAVERVELSSDIPADLAAVDPSAKWVAYAVGRGSDGIEARVPVVMNQDGSTYVDPRVRW